MRISVFTGILIFFFIISGCRNKNSIPKNVLRQEKMQAVMWDMIRADQFLANFVFSRDTAYNKVAESYKLYNEIFSIHQVTEEEFRRSYEYYSTRPQLMKTLMDSVVVIKPATPVITPSEPAEIQPKPDTVPIPPKPARLDTIRKKKGIRNLQINCVVYPY